MGFWKIWEQIPNTLDPAPFQGALDRSVYSWPKQRASKKDSSGPVLSVPLLVEGAEVEVAGRIHQLFLRFGELM